MKCCMNQCWSARDRDTLIEQSPNYSNRTFKIIDSAIQLIQSVSIKTLSIRNQEHESV